MSVAKKDIKIPHFRLPIQTAEFCDRLILVLYRLSKASSAKELRQKESSLPEPMTIGRGLSYLEYLGIVNRKGGKGIYELTEEGRSIGIELIQDNQTNADAIWQDLLRKHLLYAHIQDYIKKKGGGIRGSSIGLGEYLRDLAGEDWTSSFVKEGGKRLCNICASKGLLIFDIKEDCISFPIEQPPTPPTIPPAPPSDRVPPIAPYITPFGVDIQLKIEIVKDTPIELAEKIFDFLLQLSERGIKIKSTIEKK